MTPKNQAAPGLQAAAMAEPANLKATRLPQVSQPPQAEAGPEILPACPEPGQFVLSPLGWSAAGRLLCAAAASALLWLAVAWALNWLS
jgi:hypothetical protein